MSPANTPVFDGCVISKTPNFLLTCLFGASLCTELWTSSNFCSFETVTGLRWWPLWGLGNNNNNNNKVRNISLTFKFHCLQLTISYIVVMNIHIPLDSTKTLPISCNQRLSFESKHHLRHHLPRFFPPSPPRKSTPKISTFESPVKYRKETLRMTDTKISFAIVFWNTFGNMPNVMMKFARKKKLFSSNP